MLYLYLLYLYLYLLYLYYRRNRTGEKRPPKEEANAKRAQKRAEFRARAEVPAEVLPPAKTFFKPLQSWVQLQERWKPIRIKALEDLFRLAESPLFPPAYDIVYSLPAPPSLHDALQKCSPAIEHHVRGSVSPAVPAVSRANVLADFYFDADTHARAVSGYDWDSDAESEMLSEKLQMQMMLDEGEKAEVEMQCRENSF